jgi:hypothetical protein
LWGGYPQACEHFLWVTLVGDVWVSPVFCLFELSGLIADARVSMSGQGKLFSGHIFDIQISHFRGQLQPRRTPVRERLYSLLLCF